MRKVCKKGLQRQVKIRHYEKKTKLRIRSNNSIKIIIIFRYLFKTVFILIYFFSKNKIINTNIEKISDRKRYEIIIKNIC